MTNAIKTRDIDAGYWRRVIPTNDELSAMLRNVGATVPLGSKSLKPYNFDPVRMPLLALAALLAEAQIAHAPTDNR